MHPISPRVRACNVIVLRQALPPEDAAMAFQKLTAEMVMLRHREGTLDPAVIEALMASAGLYIGDAR